MQLDVTVLSPERTLYKGPAGSVIVPGERGEFEVLPYHKRILSRLVSGILFVDERPTSIKRGIIKVEHNNVTIIVEEEL